VYPIIHLAKGLEIPSFFLVISLVLSISLFWVSARALTFGLPQKKILDLSLLLMGASLLGARLFHVLYENPEYYAASPLKFFYLWEGGFVFFGGAFVALVAGALFLRQQKVNQPGRYFDVFTPVLAFAYGAGRIGCFLAGCCYGKSCDYAWAVEGRHPTQLYATFWEFGVVLILLGVEKQKLFKKPGQLFTLWVALHSAGRILMESYREDFRGEQIFGLSVSTVICIVLFLVAVALLILRRDANSLDNLSSQ
jgi:phosphatidylglycerol:prolipoprotein diacylglycerol transferase